MALNRSTRAALMATLAVALCVSAEIHAEEVPEGFHRMPDGTLMANNPDNAVAPPGYHMMPDGTLMANMPLDSSQTISAATHSHHHGTGAFMLRYEFMRMKMKHLQDGNNWRMASEVIANDQYMMAPRSMNMDMHMFMAMYGMTDRVTLMTMFSYLEKNMLMIDAQGREQNMTSSGEGDVTVSGIYRHSPAWLFSMGVRLPNGNIDQRGNVTMNGNVMNVRLPYGMQLGTGSTGLVPGVTYQTSNGPWTLGAKGEYTVFLQNNENGYRHGNRLEASGWARWALNHSTDFQARADLRNWDSISGQDSSIMQTMSMPMGSMKTSPLANPSNYGFTRVDISLGMSGKSRSGGFGFNLEGGMPLYQTSTGLMMRTQAFGKLSLNWMF